MWFDTGSLGKTGGGNDTNMAAGYFFEYMCGDGLENKTGFPSGHHFIRSSGDRLLYHRKTHGPDRRISGIVSRPDLYSAGSSHRGKGRPGRCASYRSDGNLSGRQGEYVDGYGSNADGRACGSSEADVKESETKYGNGFCSLYSSFFCDPSGIYSVKGSYTVEASFLFPMILTVLVLLIYLSFFLHDRCVMNEAAYQAALRGSRIKTGDNAVIGATESAAEEMIQSALLATEEVSHQVSVTGSEVTVSYEGRLNIPAGILFLPINGNGISVRGSGAAKRKDPILFIRECRVIENAAERLRQEE